MPRGKGNGAGRPRFDIDWKLADRWTEIGVPGSEIAAAFGMSADAFYDRVVKERKYPNFTAYQQEKRSKGLNNLRNFQYQSAEKGNVTMQIWLGKQYLGQKEPETTISEQSKSSLVAFMEMQKKEISDANPKPVEQATPELSGVDSKD